MNVDIIGTVELIAASMLPIGFITFMWHRIATKKSIGARAIQFVAIILLLPILLILSLEKIVESQVVGTLLGGLIGYLLSGISNYDKPKKPSDK